MTKVVLVTGGSVAARAMACALINRLEADIVICEPEERVIELHAYDYDLEPVQDVTDDQCHGKRAKKGKALKDWQL